MSLVYSKDMFDFGMCGIVLSPSENCFALPTKAYDTDTGFDLYAVEDYEITSTEVKKIDVGFRMAFPPGFDVQIRPRSGTGSKGLIIPNAPGTVDPHYRGPVSVPMVALPGFDRLIKRGDRVAQMVVAGLPAVQTLELPPEKYDALPATMRGEGGYGSTGC